MEDEVFEKYFERIEGVFDLGTSFNGNELVYEDYLYPEDERKQKLKQILEEIYQKGHDENVHYQLLKALTKKEAKDDEL